MISFPAWLPVTASLVSTTLALVAFAYQVHRARFNQSVDLLFRLENDFFGGEKVRQRALAAQNHLVDPQNFTEMEDILDFFETIAMLTRKNALDVYMVWHTFDYWVERYYALARTHIQSRQVHEPGVWQDLTWLVSKLEKIQAKKTRGVRANFTTVALTEFLTEEAAES